MSIRILTQIRLGILMLIQIRIRIDIDTMPIHMRILHQVLHKLENRTKCFTFIHSNVSSVDYVFLFSSVANVSWFKVIWKAYWNYHEKRYKKYLCSELIPIRIGKIRILENDADPTRSGSTTLIVNPEFVLSAKNDAKNFSAQSKIWFQ
jgi:hypothetical protein